MLITFKKMLGILKVAFLKWSLSKMLENKL